MDMPEAIHLPQAGGDRSRLPHVHGFDFAHHWCGAFGGELMLLSMFTSTGSVQATLNFEWENGNGVNCWPTSLG